MTSPKDIFEEQEKTKELYDYQKKAIENIFERIDRGMEKHHLLYQLPTGGGKTVIFSEITRRYLEKHNKKVVVLTHRIELCKQTSKMLSDFKVKNKVIDSVIKELPDQHEYSCFVAMVETLKNRISDEKLHLDNIGMVIVDEAHYNSFRKLFSFFPKSFILGVTATPLSSNVKLPMYENYDELIVGDTISSLIEKQFLARAKSISYEVGLTSLKVGTNGDYTIKSSDELYTKADMQEKLLEAYRDCSLNKKTLIFNNGINTSLHVYEAFKKAGYHIRHLDNTSSNDYRKETLKWFKDTPNAILTSVSILTTGFDEPTVDTIILNRATKSLTLYFQMIGRGSRILPNKKEFNVIDLGNNIARFGLWSDPIDWHEIFTSPDFYLDSLRNDEEIESLFNYNMPAEVRARFGKTSDTSFNIEEEYRLAIDQNRRPISAIEKSIEQHANMCLNNAESLKDARLLAEILQDEIEFRVKKYTKCITHNSKNYKEWLVQDYKVKLHALIGKKYRELIMSEAD